jgi:hypothetical protein
MFTDFENQFTLIQKYLYNFYEVDTDILKNYFMEWTEQTFPAKHIITAVGEVQRDMFFILEGVQKSYQISNKKAHIIEFTYFPSFSGIPDSFLTQTPSKYYLETISKTRLIKISYEKHQELMYRYREIETLTRKIVEFILFGIIDRHYEQIAFDMESRFKAQMKKRPELLNLVSQKDLASYLRIDPTNLSKLISTIKI